MEYKLKTTPNEYYFAQERLTNDLWTDIYHTIKMYGKEKKKVRSGVTEWIVTFTKRKPCIILLGGTYVRLVQAVVSERPNIQVKDRLYFYTESGSVTDDFQLKQLRQGFNVYSALFNRFDITHL